MLDKLSVVCYSFVKLCDLALCSEQTKVIADHRFLSHDQLLDPSIPFS